MVFAGLAIFSFSIRTVLVLVLYFFYAAHIGVTQYELVMIMAPSEFVAVFIFVIIQIYWLMDAFVIIVKNGEQTKQD